MMIMMIIIKVNLQMLICWQQVNTWCGEMNDDDDDDDNDNNSKSPDANMVVASEQCVWKDE